MAKISPWALPVISAFIAPTLLFWILNYQLFMGIFSSEYQSNISSIFLVSFVSVLVSIGHVLLLGLPAVWLMRRLGFFRWWSMLITGFFLGSIPLGIFTWPNYPKGTGSEDTNGVKIVDGVPTNLFWSEYIDGVVQMGIIGAITAVIFYLIWTRFNSTFNTDAQVRRLS